MEASCGFFGDTITAGVSYCLSIIFRLRICTCLSDTRLNLFRFMILSVTFGLRPDEPSRINTTAATACAMSFIGVSCAASVALAVVQRKKKKFLLRSLFMSVFYSSTRVIPQTRYDADHCRPHTISNLLALFNVLLNILSRNLFPLTAIRVIWIGLPAAFATVYGLAAYWIYSMYGPIVRGHHADDGTPLLSEEEMQRRQLFRLLQERNADRPATPDLVRNTYRLDLPVNVDAVRKDWDRSVAMPLNSGN